MSDKEIAGLVEYARKVSRYDLPVDPRKILLSCADALTAQAARIEELEKQLSLVNDSLNVTLSEKMTENWREFCDALIEETRELLGEENER